MDVQLKKTKLVLVPITLQKVKNVNYDFLPEKTNALIDKLVLL